MGLNFDESTKPPLTPPKEGNNPPPSGELEGANQLVDSSISQLIMKKTLFFTGIVVAATIMSGCVCRKTQQTTDSANTVINKVDTESPSITKTNWKLVELNGKPLSEMTFAVQPFMAFDNETKRVSGSAGCNNFSGEYEINENVMRIRFSKMITTKKMCINMTVEDQFLQVLAVVDNYTISGNTLSLNRARMAPLARFEMY